MTGDGVSIRRARPDDLPSLVALLLDDDLGRARESRGDLGVYEAAFAAIDANPNDYLAVVERDGELVGTAQLTILHGLSRRGATRAQLEAVRVAGDARGGGIGAHIVTWAIDYARQAGAQLVQLTSDKSRTDAHRFYDRHGFRATHEGYKLDLTADGTGPAPSADT